MSKSALIIDTPATCAECDLMGGNIANKYTCNGLGRIVIGDYNKGRCSDCPLKELPPIAFPTPGDYQMGRNSILEELTEE